MIRICFVMVFCLVAVLGCPKPTQAEPTVEPVADASSDTAPVVVDTATTAPVVVDMAVLVQPTVPDAQPATSH